MQHNSTTQRFALDALVLAERVAVQTGTEIGAAWDRDQLRFVVLKGEVDGRCRVFPGMDPADVEQVLRRCVANVLDDHRAWTEAQAMATA